MFILYLLLDLMIMIAHYRSTRKHINLLRLNKVYLYRFIVITYIYQYIIKLQHKLIFELYTDCNHAARQSRVKRYQGDTGPNFN